MFVVMTLLVRGAGTFAREYAARHRDHISSGELIRDTRLREVTGD